jgi:outer membrane protein assembly factor BamB
VALAALTVVGAADALAAAEATDLPGGLIVHVGCGRGERAVTLAGAAGRIVQGLVADPDDLALARNRAADAGLAGRVSFLPWDDGRLPYTDNLVNLVIVEPGARVEEAEILRVLVPGGAARLASADGPPRRLSKPWPEAMDAWTHWRHGADGNPVSRDRVVGPPRALQWTAGPAWSKKHWGSRISALVTAGGRLFQVQDETPTSVFNVASRWVLVARDAFNGVVLWRRDLPEWTGQPWGRVVRRGEPDEASGGLVLGVWGELGGAGGVRDGTEVMAAAGDRLFLPPARSGPVSAFDAATGKVLRTYEGTDGADEVRYVDGMLLVVARGTVHAIDAGTGEARWRAPGISVCAAGDRAYVIRPKGAALAALDRASGKAVWELAFGDAVARTGGKAPEGGPGFAAPLQAGAGVVLADSRGGRKAETFVVDAATGRALWRRTLGGKAFGRGSGAFLIDGLLWKLDSGKGVLTGMDPKTGKTRRTVDVPAIRYVGHHARCYEARATVRFILAKERGAEFIDLASGRVDWHNWVRGPCHRGVVPANGLLYAGQHSCRCYTETALHGFHALAPARPFAEGRPAALDADERLVRGPAYGAEISDALSQIAETDWPTYRSDAARSGATDAAVPTDLAEAWAVPLGGRITAPVVAGGTVYVAAVDAHALYALDAGSGKTRWRFVAGGRIDTPPTVADGRVLFGCRDGYVYCLRASDGRLMWRFLAALDARMVGADGQLESAWPVHGSVLVRDGLAYAVAGRSTFLDGGMVVYALDAATGAVRHGRRLEGPWFGPEVGAAKDTPNRGYVIEGALPDVLVADGEHVYLRHLRFDPRLDEMTDMQPNFYKSPQLSGENRGGDSKFWDNLVEAPRHALFTNPEWFHRSFFQNWPGRRLYCTTGLLDGSWHRRMYWSYGQVVGQYIVFRGEMGYAVQIFATSPREAGMNAGDGYVVYAGRTVDEAGTGPDGERTFALRPHDSAWRIRVPLRPVAMVLTKEHLWLAGPPDAAEPEAALEALDGRKGARLWAVHRATGDVVVRHAPAAPPAFDGAAAAGGRLYLSGTDGTLRCWAER